MVPRHQGSRHSALYPHSPVGSTLELLIGHRRRLAVPFHGQPEKRETGHFESRAAARKLGAD